MILFNNLFPFVSLTHVHKSTTMHACDAADAGAGILMETHGREEIVE